MNPIRALSLVLLIGGSAIRLTAAEPRAATALFPLDAVSATNRPLVQAVLELYTLRRDYPPRSIVARAEHLEYLFDHIEACSVLAQQAGLIRYQATRDREDRIWADDRKGAKGYLTLVVVRPGQRVYYVAGSQQGLWEARDRGVVVVNCAHTAPDTIEYHAAALVKVDNAVLAFLAQMFSVFVRDTVDRNFEGVMRNSLVLSEKALCTPAHLRKLIDRLPPADQALLRSFRALLDQD
ncbi:hypothetical protein HQ590_00590 [bacterium]|nr:hypothetical protein [bacterium]